jgi:hypothetical protein
MHGNEEELVGREHQPTQAVRHEPAQSPVDSFEKGLQKYGGWLAQTRQLSEAQIAQEREKEIEILASTPNRVNRERLRENAEREPRTANHRIEFHLGPGLERA